MIAGNLGIFTSLKMKIERGNFISYKKYEGKDSKDN
jgi:hypothetical protein